MNTPTPGNGTTSYNIDSVTGSPDNCSCCGGSNIGIGGICPPGYHCPRGSTTPVACQSGTYSIDQGQAVCQPCVAGFYCPNRTIDYQLNVCPKGHYCPQSTHFSTEFPCARGTYNPSENGQNETACQSCLPGQACTSFGLELPDANCSGGFYCISGSTTTNPVNSTEGSICPPGFYCPEGKGTT